MYKESKLITLARSLNSSARLFVSALSFFSALFIWFYFFYNPVLNKINSVDIQIKSLSEQINSYDQILVAQTDVNKEKSSLDHDFKKVANNISVEGNLRFFLDSMKKYNIGYKQVKPVDSKLKEFVEKKYFTIVASGEFGRFMQFLSFLENANKAIKFKELNLSWSSKNILKIFAKVRLINFNT